MTDELESGPAEDRVLEFFDAMCAVHAQAVAIAGGEERHFLIGSKRVCLRFAGPALPTRLTPALDHLAVAPGSGDLTVLLWDSISSGVPPARSPWQPDAYTPRGDLRGNASGRLRAGFSLGSSTLSMLDLERGLGLYWMHDARQLPPWEVAAPLRTMLGWWAAGQGAQLAHGAAVGIGDDAVLLVGRGGSGKSTTALACLDRGLRYAGDDYVLLRPDGGGPPTVHSLYRTGKLRPQDLALRLPNLRLRRFAAPDYDKAVLLLEGRPPRPAGRWPHGPRDRDPERLSRGHRPATGIGDRGPEGAGADHPLPAAGRGQGGAADDGRDRAERSGLPAGGRPRPGRGGGRNPRSAQPRVAPPCLIAARS